MSENFPKGIKKAFLLKWTTTDINFELNIDNNNLKSSVYGQVYSEKHWRLLPKHCRPFCGDNLISKHFHKLSLVESFFNQNTGQQAIV